MKKLEATKPYPQYDEHGEVEATFTGVSGADGLFIPMLIKKDLTKASESEVVDAVLEEFFKQYYVERAMGEAIEKVNDLEKTTKKVDKAAKGAQALAVDAKARAEHLEKMTRVQAIFMLTSGLSLDPDVYRNMLELIEKPVEGTTYQPFDIFAIEDTDYEPSLNEGKLAFVQVLSEFTYNNEDAKALKAKAEDGEMFVANYGDLAKG
ncbi:hypothetical protein AKK44_07225 [Streptococcus phocae]|uniref:Phage protein n=2 Tax=Streptococcus phocae TaxID=119224 RepID=A0A0P6SQK6_9STRE|nr:hypothetical protein AKK44_07225 [Streptococcus phocae]